MALYIDTALPSRLYERKRRSDIVSSPQSKISAAPASFKRYMLIPGTSARERVSSFRTNRRHIFLRGFCSRGSKMSRTSYDSNRAAAPIAIFIPRAPPELISPEHLRSDSRMVPRQRMNRAQFPASPFHQQRHQSAVLAAITALGSDVISASQPRKPVRVRLLRQSDNIAVHLFIVAEARI